MGNGKYGIQIATGFDKTRDTVRNNYYGRFCNVNYKSQKLILWQIRSCSRRKGVQEVITIDISIAGCMCTEPVRELELARG